MLFIRPLRLGAAFAFTGSVLDRDLETIVARCLESDPKARYQSAGALAET